MTGPEFEPKPENDTGEKPFPDPRILTLQDPNAPETDKDSAFAGIYEEYSGLLYGFVLKKTLSPEVAEEVVQVSLMNAWGAIDRFDDLYPDSLRKWLFTITNNATRNILRREKKYKGNASFDEEIAVLQNGRLPENEDPLEYLLLKEDLFTIKSLSDTVRTTLSWDVPEKSYEEIAKENGITVTAVKSRLVRARKASRKAREELGLTEAEKEAKKAARAKPRRKEINGGELVVAT